MIPNSVVIASHHKHPCLDQIADAATQLGMNVTRVDTEDLGDDAIFVRDSVCSTPFGWVKCQMSNPARVHEPEEIKQRLSVEYSLTLSSKARFEGADLLFIHKDIAILGVGDRTNELAFSEISDWLHGYGVIVHKLCLPTYHDQHLLGVLNKYHNTVYHYVSDERTQRQLSAMGLPFSTLPMAGYSRKAINWLETPHGVIQPACVGFEPLFRVERVSIPTLLQNGGGVACATRPIYENTQED